MKIVPYCICLLAALGVPSAYAGLEVRFIQPEHYTDIGDRSDADRILKEFDQYLNMLGARYLGPRQRLTIDILDIDLAGRVEMLGRQLELIRVLRGRADAPALHLRYTLYDGDQLLSTGEELLTDAMYLEHAASIGADGPLYYEKQLLLDWFRARFQAPAKD